MTKPENKTTEPPLWQCPACRGWYPDTAPDEPEGVCETCYEEACRTVLGVAADVLQVDIGAAQISEQQRPSQQSELPYAHVRIPPLSADDALTLVGILEHILAAIWKAHGDAMAELQARRGIETPPPPDAVVSHTAVVDDAETDF